MKLQSSASINTNDNEFVNIAMSFYYEKTTIATFQPKFLLIKEKIRKHNKQLIEQLTVKICTSTLHTTWQYYYTKMLHNS